MNPVIIIGGGVVIVHVAAIGIALGVYQLQRAFAPRPQGQTLPAVGTVLPPPTSPVVVAEPVMVAAAPERVGDGGGVVNDVLLSVEKAGPDAVALHIPATCQVDYSIDLQNWEMLGVYPGDTVTIVWTADSDRMFFRAHPVRP